jgi:hypothetical protein
MWSFTTGSMLGWWKFDERGGTTAADASGSGHTGQLARAPEWRPGEGVTGGALLLNGSCVRIEQESPFDLTEAITLSLWTRVDGLDRQWQALVTKGDSAWRLHRAGNRDTVEFHCDGLRSGHGAWVALESRRSIDAGQWHHIVATYDGRRVALYIDGMLDASCPAWGRIQTNDYPVCIGDNAEQPGRYWNGLIDDVRIYSYALSEAEIVDLYGARGGARSASSR